MNVLFVAYDKDSSGIASYTYELVKALRNHLNASLLTFEEDTIRSLNLSGVEVINCKLKFKSRALPFLNYLLNRNFLKRTVKLDKFDVIHETLPPWGSFLNLKTLLTTKWGYVSYLKLAAIRTAGMSFPENLGGLPVTLQHYLLDELSFRRAKYIVQFSDASKENFVPPIIERGRLKKYSCDDKLKILFVARDLNVPRKNLKALLMALKHINRPAELHLVGNGKVEASSNVKLIGHGYLMRDEVFMLMQDVDLQVLPSTYEELGFVGLEAYSVGLPLIVSNIPSFRAIFKVSPSFDPYNPLELARLINSLSCEELEKLGRNEWEFLGLSNAFATKKLLTIYNNLIQDN
ncbi:MAG: glycosyltransferase family 4 protein [Nitrososphaeria archaeon]